MADNVSQRIRDALESLISDKKTVVRILSIVMILLIAVILRIHEDSKADITIESAETAEETELSEDGSGRLHCTARMSADCSEIGRVNDDTD